MYIMVYVHTSGYLDKLTYVVQYVRQLPKAQDTHSLCPCRSMTAEIAGYRVVQPGLV